MKKLQNIAQERRVFAREFLNHVSESGRLNEFDIKDADGYVQFVFALAEEKVQDVFARVESVGGPTHLIVQKDAAIWAIKLISNTPQSLDGEHAGDTIDSQTVHPESEFGMLLDLFETSVSNMILVKIPATNRSSGQVLEGTELADA